MEYLETVFVVLQLVSAVAIILLVLFQQGKGAEMGAAFGNGASGSLFGATGSSNFLSRATAIAVTFLIVSALGYAYVRTSVKGPSVMSDVKSAPAKVSEVPVPKPAPDLPKKTDIPK